MKKNSLFIAISNILKMLGCLLLIFLAVVLFVVIIPFAIFWKIWVSIFHENRKVRDILSGTGQFFKAIAISIDKFGNVAFGGFLCWLFLKTKKYPFGNTHETISEVLGWAAHYQDLTKTGKLLKAILNFLDQNHCANARAAGIEKAFAKIDMYHKTQKIR